MPEATTRPPGSRRDAKRNRGLLVAAARTAFAEYGVEARPDEIARRAGVGTGTLYRHFPTREALVEAVFAERIGVFVAAAETALDQADAWVGLVGFLETTLETGSGDPALKEILLRYPPAEVQLSDSRARINELLARLLERARRQGSLRRDFELADLTVLLWSFAPVIDATAHAAPRFWRRHLHWILDGLRADAATPQSEQGLDDGELAAATASLREHRLPSKPPRARRTSRP